MICFVGCSLYTANFVVARVLMPFGQRLAVRRDAGEFDKEFQFSLSWRPTAINPEDFENEIGTRQDFFLGSGRCTQTFLSEITRLFNLRTSLDAHTFHRWVQKVTSEYLFGGFRSLFVIY